MYRTDASHPRIVPDSPDFGRLPAGSVVLVGPETHTLRPPGPIDPFGSAYQPVVCDPRPALIRHVRTAILPNEKT